VGLALPVVWSDRCRLHDPGGEVWIGIRTPATEVVARADAILAALVEVDACVVDAERHPDTALRAVHDVALLEFLESAWDEWTAAGLDREPGQDRVVPYVFAHAALTSAHFWWTLVKDAFESALNGPCGDGTKSRPLGAQRRDRILCREPNVRAPVVQVFLHLPDERAALVLIRRQLRACAAARRFCAGKRPMPSGSRAGVAFIRAAPSPSTFARSRTRASDSRTPRSRGAIARHVCLPKRSKRARARNGRTHAWTD
jgi:hypothetical protein